MNKPDNSGMFKMLSKFTRKSLAEPDDALLSLFGAVSTISGVTVTAASALRVPAVASAVRLISEAVADLDVLVKRVGTDGAETEDKSHPLLGILRGEANDWTDGFTFIRDLMIDALTRDEGGLAYVNRVNGRVVEVIRYALGAISVDYDPLTLEPTYRLQGAPIPSQNVVHLRSPFGKAPLSLAREAIALATVLERHGSKLFGNGARPSGLLKFPKGMGEEAVKRAREGWRQTHENGDTGRTAILYDDADFVPLTFNSVDAQYLELRTFQIVEIARAFRVPPSMIYELSRATWSNAEQMNLEFLTYCLDPRIKAMEGALRRALFMADERAKYAIRFDRDDLTRADLATRSTAINSLIASRVLNPNEGREWLGLDPYEGGNAFINPNITQTEGVSKDAPAPDDEGTDGTE